jgi:glycosyltransferase involved in cell wall biosynthesis
VIALGSVRTVARVVRNAPTAISVIWRHLEMDPSYAASVMLRALPRRLRKWLVRLAGKRRSPAAAIIVAADGNKTSAVARLREAANDARPRQLRRLIAAAAALDAPDTARQLLDRLPLDDPDWPRLSALVRTREGQIAFAVNTDESRDDTPAGRRGKRFRRRLAAELRALSDETVTLSAPDSSPQQRLVADRVLHLVTNSLPEVTAGYTTRTQGIAAAQVELGLDVHVSTRLGFPVTAGFLAAPSYVEVANVSYHRSLPRRGLPRTNDRLVEADIDATSKLCKRLRPAVLHAHSKHVNAQVALALRARHGIPVIYEVRGFLEETWRSRGRNPDADAYRLARSIETACMQAADAVVTISDVMRDEIIGRGVRDDRVTVIPNAVDDSFLDGAPDASALRRDLGVDASDVVIGVVTTMNSYEGIEVLVDAVAQLRRVGAPVKFLGVGDGPMRQALIDRARSHELGDFATFPGQVPFENIRRYHAVIDVFCVPRLDVPVTRLVTPLKPLEAMAIGRPVVASDLPPLREIVQPDVTGKLVTANDPAALAEALGELVGDAALRDQLGKHATHWVAEHRTWSTAALRYRELYRALSGAAVV